MRNGFHSEPSEDGFGVESLADELALWRLSPEVGPRGLIECACAALVAGVDSPALRELAGLPYDADYWSTTGIAERTFEELFGFPLPAPVGELWEYTLSAMARRHLAGSLDAHDLTYWSYAAIGHEGIAAAQRLVELDDDYDAIPFSFGSRDTRSRNLGARVTEEARIVLAARARVEWPGHAK